MKINKYIYLSIAAASVMASCKKSFLDEKPTTAVTVTSSILTENDMADAVNGMYNVMKSTLLFGRDVPVLGDLLADNTYVNAANSGRYLSENNYSFISVTAEPANIWNQGYYAISQANRIILEGKKLPASTNVSQLLGEAYTARALVYLQLVNFYGAPATLSLTSPGVPIVTLPAYIGSASAAQPSRATVGAVYTKIISDLDSAYAIMPGTAIPLHATNSDYLSKYAAKAIEARAYLYKGDYASARDAALLVVQNGGYSLAATPAAFTSYWSSPTAVTNKLETIFELNENASSNNGNTGLDAIYSQAGYGDIQATTDLYNAYSATDVRRTLMLDSKRGGQQAYIINKYSNYTNPDKDENKIIRYAEVILTLAEGYARTGDEPDALINLNKIATLRDPSFLGYTSTGTQLLSDILNERRKELAFEGLRWFDLTRLNMVINRPTQVQGYPSYPTVTTSDFRRILPIPQAERDANPNVAQNPGY